MCVGIPAQLLSVDGIAGHCADGTLVDLSLVPDAGPGDWVLTFLGSAHEVIDATTAAQIVAALEGLRNVMQGLPMGDAFADLDARGPQLPPHLQAALDAGHSKG